MATISEANAINTVLRYLLNHPSHTGIPADTEALDAAAFLADRALMAGLDGDDVRKAWPRRRSATPEA